MCELFAAQALRKVKLNELLQEFFSHGKDHPHGWGMAFLTPHGAATEKEPAAAHKSSYLRHRLTSSVCTNALIAHIRLATKGSLEYRNTHPFTMPDATGRAWTLAHNGTIFDCDVLNRYALLQEGSTDSERILMYIVDKINEAIAQKALRLATSPPQAGLQQMATQDGEGEAHVEGTTGGTDTAMASGTTGEEATQRMAEAIPVGTGQLELQVHDDTDTLGAGNRPSVHEVAAGMAHTALGCTTSSTAHCAPSFADASVLEEAGETQVHDGTLSAVSLPQALELTAEERFCVVESVIREITPENKVNLLLFDGELLYAHTNYRASLHISVQDGSAFISTRPLSTLHWQELRLNTLVALKDGQVVRTARAHTNEFFDSEEKMRLLFIDYSSL